MVEQIALFFISLIANTLSSLAGGGAGLLQLPAIVFLGLPFSVALATHKIASVFLGVGASVKHLQQGEFKLPILLIMTVAALPGVVLGASVILAIPQNTALIALGVLTISLGVYSGLKPELGTQENLKNHDLSGYLIGGAGLFVIGFLNGSLTSGTGLFVTMWLVYWFGMGYIKAVSYTLVLVGILWNGTGALTLTLLSSVKWEWLPVLILGSLLGGYFGAQLALSKGNALVKRAFELMTISVGTALLYKAWLANQAL